MQELYLNSLRGIKGQEVRYSLCTFSEVMRDERQ